MNRLAVIFDMDGLLFNTEQLCRDIWIQLCEEHGFSCTYEQYAACIGHNEKDVIAIIREMFGETFPYSNFFVLVRERMVEYFDKFGPPEKPGIRPLFNFLKENGVPFALATSNNREHAFDMLTRTGLKDSFAAFAFGNEVPHGKPEPDIFLMAAKRLETLPENCIVFEDSPAGLMAAHKAGMKSVFIKDLAEVGDEVRATVWESCATLEDAIEPIRGLL